MNFRRFFARTLAAAVVMATIGVAAEADPIPQDWLNNLDGSCLKSCAAQKIAPDRCETACTCIEQQTAATMTKDEFTAVDKNQSIPPELTAKAQAIQDRCTQ